MDDKEMTASEELSLRRMVGEIKAPSVGGGLYVAGVPALSQFGVSQAGMVGSMAGFRGNIRDIVFIDDEYVTFTE